MLKVLEGKRGVIFGALDDQSIAWKVAEKCKEHGAQVVLSNAPVAFRLGKIHDLAKIMGTEAIPADATKVEDLEALFSNAEEQMGGKFDFVLHSIGMSVNVRKKRDYHNLSYDWMQRTFDISAISFHKVMQTLYKMDMMKDWGSILGLTYIASQRTYPSYSEMAESKALLESFARSFGYHFGEKNKVRVNTISQSPTYTKAGSGVEGFNDFYNYADGMSPLGNASAEDCANYCVLMFSELSKMVTMQNLFHDGGYSNMGFNPALKGMLGSK